MDRDTEGLDRDVVGEPTWCLRWVEDGVPRRAVVAAAESVLGVASDAAVVVRGRGVSRRHACILSSHGCLTLHDCGSKNGTWLNGVRVVEAELRPGDRIGLGPTELRLEAVDPEDAELALAIAAPRDGRGLEIPEGDDLTSTEGEWGRGGVPRTWLVAISRSVADLLPGPQRDPAAALEHLVSGLGLSGATVLEWSPGCGPSVLHSAGDVAGIERLASAAGEVKAAVEGPHSLHAPEGDPAFVLAVAEQGDGRRLCVGADETRLRGFRALAGSRRALKAVCCVRRLDSMLQLALV